MPAILLFNEDLKLVYVNEAFERLADISEREVLGKNLNEANLISKNQWSSLQEELVNYSKGHYGTFFNEGKKQNVKKERFFDPLTPKTINQILWHSPTFDLGDRNFAYKFFDIVIADNAE